ncbi:MAG TPA: ATP-binding protein [Gemmataceae bacterium]|jgi:signal transduction histidine kinase|nr:ATP-binding protein [Gemmataceae bacterium]
MKGSIRLRIFWTLLPLLGLLTILGVAGFILLSQLSRRIDVILRENYDSVLYMENLNEAVERIDSGLQFALAGHEDLGRRQYAENWKLLLENLGKEQNNITLPGEDALVKSLTDLTQQYRETTEAFFASNNEKARSTLYFRENDQPGLLAVFTQIKTVAGQILRLNQENMEEASRQARRTADASLVWFGIALAATACLAFLGGLHMVRTILQPIQAITESARAIGDGNLDQVVPIVSDDELGQLARAFNSMARQLRGYRQSQQARLMRLQQTSQAAIDALPHPVLVVDPAGQIELANPAMQRVLAVLPPVAGQGSPIPWQPPEPLRQPLIDALAEQRAYTPEGFDRAITLRDGTLDRLYLPRVLPINDAEGATLGAAVVLEDVTRFHLLDEVKSNLVATASHELKTPLTSLRLAVHILLEESVGPLTPKQLELLLDARDNMERLLEMINTLLDLARLQEASRKLRLTQEDPGSILQGVADSIEARAADKHVAIALQIPPSVPPIAVDRDEIEHALTNLLDNALQHSDNGDTIQLGLTVTANNVCFSVTDHGPGIAPEYMPHLFEKFFRVPGQKSTEGTGLGLAIVREIATAHGGDVSCISRRGEGTTFRLELLRADVNGRT